MDDIRKMIAAERGALAAVLADLPPARWDSPTLCDGWRVREVVAHITMPFRYPGPRFMLELARSRGRFSVMSDRVARRDAGLLSPTELTAALRDNVQHPWKPPGGGYLGALNHDVIHGLDITVALGIDRRIPADTMHELMANITTAKALRYFGVDLTGISLQATDLDWTYGSGAPLLGSAQDLALVLCGRKLPASRLGGASSRFIRLRPVRKPRCWRMGLRRTIWSRRRSRTVPTGQCWARQCRAAASWTAADQSQPCCSRLDRSASR